MVNEQIIADIKDMTEKNIFATELPIIINNTDEEVSTPKEETGEELTNPQYYHLSFC